MSAKHRVLIVDDQPANIRLIAEALDDRCELFFATDGQTALRRAARGDLDLVLLDVQMPEMDGFSVCRQLKAQEVTRSLPVIFVTALGEVADEAAGFEAGGVDYITKPISPPIVRARVRTHLELKRTRDLLEQLAMVDALTGVANRRRFDTVLAQEWSRAARASRWLTLAIVDVDEFKKFNDAYGHARGDECLRLVASALADSMNRPGDLAARYGGEEFGVILAETDASGAALMIRDMLERVARLEIEHAGSAGGRVSVSLGAVSVVPGIHEMPADALELSDQMLYEAKRDGRNRAVLFDQETEKKRTISTASAGVPGGAA